MYQQATYCGGRAVVTGGAGLAAAERTFLPN